MSPPRTAYRAPKARREVFFAVLGVLTVLVFTGVMLWVLAPESDAPSVPSTPITAPTVPTDSSTPSAAPGSSVPTDSTAPTTAPVTSSSAPGG